MGVLVAGGCLEGTSGEMALAPRLGILGRGAFRVNGQWGPNVPAFRSPLGAALHVSGEPRDRMGFRGSARQHARHQLEWHVHRIGRSLVDWRGIYGAFGIGSAGKGELLREAHRAGARHGRCGDALRGAARAALSRSSCFSLQHRFLSSSYTMLAAARVVARGKRCVRVYSPPSFGTAFEVV